MDCQCKLSPEIEIIYSEVSVKINYVCLLRKLFLTTTITRYSFSGVYAGNNSMHDVK
jgi:hypothetical protein